MFEFFFFKKSLWPRKRQLSAQLIGLLSLFVISIVVWLLLLFLSITEGIEKSWLSKLTALNAPLRITPNEAYYNSYYYQIDTLSHTSGYALKSIQEKLMAEKSDPYDPEIDEEIPSKFPQKENIDPVKALFSCFSSLGLVADEYEVAGALMRLELIRPRSRNQQSFLSQVSYIASYPKSPSHLSSLVQKPTKKDVQHLIYLSSLYAENDLLERILANISPSCSIETLTEEEIYTEFEEMPKLPPPWAYFVKGKLILPENGIILPKQFRDNDVLLGDKGYFAYQAITPVGSEEERLPLYVSGFYDPGVIAIGARFILADPGAIRTINVSSQITSLDPLLVNGVQVWFQDLKKTKLVQESICQKLKEAGIDRYWNVIPYYEYDFAKELIAQFQSDRYLFMLVGILILLVASSNIISLLLLLVNDKKHEIGVLLSLGASKTSIASIFGGIGMTVGIISSFIGIGCAYFTLSHIDIFVSLLSSLEGQEAFNPLFYGNSLPNKMSLRALLFVVISCPILSLLAGLVPAIKACRLKPSAILRSE